MVVCLAGGEADGLGALDPVEPYAGGYVPIESGNDEGPETC